MWKTITVGVKNNDIIKAIWGGKHCREGVRRKRGRINIHNF